MGIEVFIIIVVIYAVMGIGTAKILAALNSDESGWDGGVHIMVFFSWPIFIIASAFWNFKK